MLDDHLVRMAAFQYLGHLQDVHGDLLPWSALTAGFSYDGQTIPLIGAAGIWKPQALEVPISITTSPKNPYGDSIGSDGLLEYRHQGSAARSYDNDGLRRATREARPVIYFHGLEKGRYSALYPAVIVGDDPARRTFTVACEDVQLLRPDLSSSVVDDVRRRYVTRLAVRGFTRLRSGSGCYARTGTSAACATCGTSSCSTPRTSWRIVTSTGIRS